MSLSALLELCDVASIAIANAAMANGLATEIYFNKALSTITGNPAAGALRPDVAVKYPGPEYGLYEIPSPSQTISQMNAKGNVMVQNLANLGINSTCETVTVPNANAGRFTVRGLGALSILSMFTHLFELHEALKEDPNLPLIDGLNILNGTPSPYPYWKT